MSDNRSLFHKAHRRLKEVKMGYVETTIFGEENRTAAGTQNLQGCSAIAVVSRTAAIVAHVEPLPNPRGPNRHWTGTQNMTAKLELIQGELETHADHFQDARIVFLFARNRRGLGCEDQLEAAEHFFKEELEFDLTDGRKYQFHTYWVPNNRVMPGYGTLFIDSAAENLHLGWPKIFVENRLAPFDGWRNQDRTKFPILHENGMDKLYSPNEDLELVYRNGEHEEKFDKYDGVHNESWNIAWSVYDERLQGRHEEPAGEYEEPASEYEELADEYEELAV